MAFSVRRDFPSYTLKQLQENVQYESDAVIKIRMENEIAARKTGKSKPRVTTQVAWHRAIYLTKR